MVGRFHLLVALGLAWVATACQTAQRPASVLPPQASAPALQAAAPAPPAPVEKPAPEAAPQPKPDPITELISKVDKEYAAGEDSAKAGNDEAARLSLERARNLLTDSKLDLQSDSRLQEESAKIAAAVASLEPQTAQGENPGERKAEPAPIDEVNEATPAVDPSLKAKAEEEVKRTHSDLPLMLTDPVAGYINYFSDRGRGTLERALARSGRYQEMIQQILREEGVPQDLIYLAQAESGFHPLALSRAGARGMWQFMAIRAKGYGLRRNLWIDERQDPEKSTRAAAHHLKDLYNQFGDWNLAMAAYNSGPGTIQQAVKRTGYADFWELYKRNVLPRETRNYVPIILAATIMAKNPSQYGLDDVSLDEPVPYETVIIDYPVDLRLVAQCVDAPLAALQDLNPSLLRWSTPPEGVFNLRLPAGTKEKYQSAIASIPEDKRVWWRYHKVASGDTLASIARAYRSTPQAILSINHLESAELLPESKLVIPIAPGKHPTAEDGQTYARRLTRYRAHSGDTVQTVADYFAVPAAMVRRWNHLKGNSLGGRRIVYVHLPVQPSPQSPQTTARAKARPSVAKPKTGKTLSSANGNSEVVRHKVKPGETLYSIASIYNTTVSAIRRDNRMVDVASLRPGMILVIHNLH